MKIDFKILTNVGLSVLILSVGFVGLKIFGQKPEIPTDPNASKGNAADVIVTEVVSWDQPINLQVNGEASTYRIVTVGTEVEGRVTRKSPQARSGTFVRKGESLFEVNKENYELELKRLNAQLNQAQEELAGFGVDLANSDELIKLATEDVVLQQKHLKRMQQLAVRSTANLKEVDDALKQELVARNSLRTLENQKRSLQQQQKTKLANIALLESQIERAQLDLNRCTIRSPLDGRIVDDIVEEGDYLKSGDDLVRISDGSRMEVRCQLESSEIAWVYSQHRIGKKPDQEIGVPEENPDLLRLPEVRCQVAFEFQGVETVWDGVISSVDGTGMDRETRMFPCRVLVSEPRGRVMDTDGGQNQFKKLPVLLSGLYVNIRIPVESPDPLLRLPVEAVRPGGRVWKFEDGKLNIVRVTQAHVEGDNVLIYANESELEAGDQVIISPLASAYQDMNVQLPGDEKETVE